VWGLPLLVYPLIKYGLIVLPAVAWVLVVATVAGAAGGAAFSLLQPLRAYSRPVWAIATGYLSAAAYLLVAVLGCSYVVPDISLRSRAGMFAYAICVAVFGLVMAGIYYDLGASRKRRPKQRRKRPKPAV
jgi:hypothetical protein